MWIIDGTYCILPQNGSGMHQLYMNLGKRSAGMNVKLDQKVLPCDQDTTEVHIWWIGRINGLQYLAMGWSGVQTLHLTIHLQYRQRQKSKNLQAGQDSMPSHTCHGLN